MIGFGSINPSVMRKKKERNYSKILRRNWDKNGVSQAIGNGGLNQFILSLKGRVT